MTLGLLLAVICITLISLIIFPERLAERATAFGGLSDTTIESIAWSPSGTVLKNATFPKLGLHIEQATIYAMPADLMRGRLGKVVIDGFSYHYTTSADDQDSSGFPDLVAIFKNLDLRVTEITVDNGRIFVNDVPVATAAGTVYDRGETYDASLKLKSVTDQPKIKFDAVARIVVTKRDGSLKGQVDINGGAIDMPPLSLRRAGGWVNIEITPGSAMPLVNAQLAVGSADIGHLPLSDITLAVSGDLSRLQALLNGRLAQSDEKGGIEAEAVINRADGVETTALRLDIDLPNLEKLNIKNLGGALAVNGKIDLQKPVEKSYTDLTVYQSLGGDFNIKADKLSFGETLRQLNAQADLAVYYDASQQKIIVDTKQKAIKAALVLANQPWDITIPNFAGVYDAKTAIAHIDMSGASAKLPQVHIADISANISAMLSPFPTAEGKITVKEITSVAKPALFKPLKLEGQLSSLSSQQYATGFDAVLTGQAGALMVKMQGWHNSEKKNGQLRGRLEPLDLKPGITALGEFFPALDPYVSDVYGSFGAFGTARWQDGPKGTSLTSQGQIKLENVSGNYAGDFPFTGLTTVLSFDSLTPPAFTRQQVAIGAFTAGLPLQNGLMTLSLKNGKDLSLHDGQMDMAGGKVTVAPFTLDLEKRTGRITLGAGGLDLEKLFAIAPMEGLSASGEVDGTLPLSLTASGVVLDNGVLQSTGPGILKYAPQQLPSFLKDDTNQGIVTLRTAIANFHFSNLRMGLKGNLLGDQAITLTIEGQNPDFYGGHPVKLNLNVEGPLQNILRYAPGTSTIPDTIEKQLEQFEENNALPQ